MTLESEISATDRPGVYHLAIGETESYAGLGEFSWPGRLDEIELFAARLLAQVARARRTADPDASPPAEQEQR